MRKKRVMYSVVVALLLLATGLTLRWYLSSERRRRTWAHDAVSGIDRLARDRSWVAEQTNGVKRQMSEMPRQQGAWVGHQVAIMGDGEWIAFKNECVHRHALLGDIFIGKASNGRWYYSSFHFCCEMIVPQMDEQPADLPTFI